MNYSLFQEKKHELNQTNRFNFNVTYNRTPQVVTGNRIILYMLNNFLGDF